jgi:type IX secretion system PorP/SprF family membrane protein
MGKLFILLLTLCLSGPVAMAQQFEQYSLFGLNRYAYNPAYGGMAGGLQATALHRAQWGGLDGAPTTNHFNVHLPVYAVSGGFGCSFIAEEIGAWTRWSLGGSWAQHIAIGRNAILSAAISGRILQRSLNGFVLRAPEGVYEDGEVVHNDVLLSDQLQSGTAFSVGAGAFLQAGTFEAGMALTSINRPVYSFSGQAGLPFQEASHLFIHAGYAFNPSESVEILPIILVKSDMVIQQFDFSLQMTLAGTFFVGGGYRGWNADSSDAALAFGGIRLPSGLNIAYCYDIPLSDLKVVQEGSHEILLSWTLGSPIGKGRPPRILYHPRFL